MSKIDSVVAVGCLALFFACSEMAEVPHASEIHADAESTPASAMNLSLRTSGTAGAPDECDPPDAASSDCDTGSDCTSGLCLKLSAGNICTTSCDADGDCPATNPKCLFARGPLGYCAPEGRGTP